MNVPASVSRVDDQQGPPNTDHGRRAGSSITRRKRLSKVAGDPGYPTGVEVRRPRERERRVIDRCYLAAQAARTRAEADRRVAVVIEAVISKRLAVVGVRDPDLPDQTIDARRALAELNRIRIHDLDSASTESRTGPAQQPD